MSRKSKLSARQRRRKKARRVPADTDEAAKRWAVRAGLPAGEVQIVRKLGGISMSDVLLEFAKPIASVEMSIEAFRVGIKMAVAAWNLAETPAGEREEALRDYREVFAPAEAELPGTEGYGEALLRRLIRRKQEKYGHIRRFILDTKVLPGRDEYNVTVLSTPTEPLDSQPQPGHYRKAP